MSELSRRSGRPASSVTGAAYWDRYHRRRRRRPASDVAFADLFTRFLVPDAEKTVLEVGCGGGIFLAHLAQAYRYRPFGVDFSEGIEDTRDLFGRRGLPAPTLYKEDFFTWDPGRKFDMVCSFGFVEHFPDLSAVIRRHAALVAPGGMLWVTMPHFAHLQYLFHWLIDRENLRDHNTSVMNRRALARSLRGLPFDVVHLSYYRTFGFWTERRSLRRWELAVERAIRWIGIAAKKALGKDHPNPLFSPHLVLVARRAPEGLVAGRAP